LEAEFIREKIILIAFSQKKVLEKSTQKGVEEELLRSADIYNKIFGSEYTEKSFNQYPIIWVY
jgi:hypothetical protein